MASRVLQVPGFRAAGVHCGIKQGDLDLALIASDVPASVAGVFTTSTVVAPGGQVDPSRFHLLLPVGRVGEILGDPGALPTVLAGETPWIVTPDVEGSTDPVLDIFPGALDGSFTASVGHLPD